MTHAPIRSALVLTCAGSLALAAAGCAKNADGSISLATAAPTIAAAGPVVADVAAEAAALAPKIGAAAKSVCNYVPTLTTLTALAGKFAGGNADVAAGVTLATLAEEAGQEVCDAVDPQTPAAAKSVKRKAGLPTVRGVAIHGRFVS